MFVFNVFCKLLNDAAHRSIRKTFLDLSMLPQLLQTSLDFLESNAGRNVGNSCDLSAYTQRSLHSLSFSFGISPGL